MHNLHVSVYSLLNLHKSSIYSIPQSPKLHWIWQWRTSFAQFLFEIL